MSRVAIAATLGAAGCTSGGPAEDMTSSPDLSAGADLSMPDLQMPDLQMPDLAPPPDLTEYAAPTVTGVTPLHVQTATNTTVHVMGTNFWPITRVFFDGVEATGVSSMGPTEMLAAALARPGKPGWVAVSVENPVNHRATIDKGFYYDPTFYTATPGAAVDVSDGFISQTALFVDVDKDGVKDIVLSLPPTDARILVYNGKADGTFTGPTTLTDPSTPSWLAAADLTGDGYPDLVTADIDSWQVSVRVNDGKGGFGAIKPISFPKTVYVQYVALGDLDGDGKRDLVVSLYQQPLSIFIGNGDGTFAAPRTVAAPGTNPAHVAIGHFRNSSVLDLAVQDSLQKQVALLPNDGTGNFGSPTSTTVGQVCFSLTIGDFNNDKVDDLACPTSGMGGLRVVLGGSGGFTLATPPSFNTADVSLSTADFNGDGFLDVVMPSMNGGFDFYLGNGDGTFYQGPNLSKTTAQARFAFVGATDVNKDGIPDVVTIGGERLPWQLGTAAITYK